MEIFTDTEKKKIDEAAMLLIENWEKIKETIQSQINKDLKTIEILNNFKI